MTLEEKVIGYVTGHLNNRGRCRIGFEALIWRLADLYPGDPRPTVGQLHRTLESLKLRHKLIVRHWGDELQFALPEQPPAEPADT